MNKIDWLQAAKAAKRAAKRFAPAYGALDWEWSSGGIGAEIRDVPSEARILETLWAMVADVHTKLERSGGIVGEEGIQSYGTGGLSVTLDNEGTLHFVMDVTESEFGCVIHAKVAAAETYERKPGAMFDALAQMPLPAPDDETDEPAAGEGGERG